MSQTIRISLLATTFVVVLTLLNSQAGAVSQKVLYNFAGNPDGAGPQAALVMDAAGNLYGTTFGGGANYKGTVFELQNNNGQWTESVLYSFGAFRNDGTNPAGKLVFDKAGNLYGTTNQGGANSFGTVFRLTPTSNGWKETTLYNFGAFAGDASSPTGGVFLDGHGNIFGVTKAGGTGPCLGIPVSGCGAFFELSHSSGKWTESVLYSFNASPDAASPSGDLIADSQGNFYGPSLQGGSTYCATGCGTVYELSPSASGGWTEKIIYAPATTFYPVGTLLLDRAGNLYGTSTQSPNFGVTGTVFELSPASDGWSETIVYDFAGRPDGSEPESGLVRDQAGNLYGTTYWGGGGRCLAGQGCGTVFVLQKSNGGWQEHYVGLNGPQLPAAGLVLDSAGNAYGTSTTGGAFGFGTVFEISR